MEEITEEELRTVFNGIHERSQDELRGMRQEDLENFWFFRYDPVYTSEWNLYQFTEMLRLYSRRCRQWEEMHHGSMCVVERVRDTYLMPKIREFIELTRMTGPGNMRLPTNRDEARAMVLYGTHWLEHNPE